MRTEEISVYPVSIFDTAGRSCWIGQLERILESYPILEFPHKQSFYMLLYVEEASGMVIIDNRHIRLDRSKVICIKPNSVFSLDINRSARGSIICFTESFFSLRYNNNVLYQFSFLKKDANSAARLTATHAEKWDRLINLMQYEYTQQPQGAEKVLRSYLNILLFDLDRLFHAYRPAHTNSKEGKLIQFEQLLEEHYLQYKVPSFYAGQLHITTNYLNKLCRAYRGITSGELIRKRITIEAQRLLYYTTLSVGEVAYKLGFENPSYFVTFFKKQTELTPEYFRKINT